MRVVAIIPAHNEAAILEGSAKKVWAWGREAFGAEFRLVLSENGSSDSSAWVGRLMEKLLPGVTMVSSNVPGKGAAIKRAAASVEADAYLMMDADLSADLASAEALVRAVEAGADAAIGSRRAPGAEVARPLLRRTITAAYAQVVRAALGLAFRDMQCGCKAFSRRVRDEVFPQVRDGGFFFDTELLARMGKAGMRVDEIGVRWSERPAEAGGSRVKILPVGLEFLRKAAALRKDLR